MNQSENRPLIVPTAAKRIGRRIRRIRESKGLSQSELGALVGLTGDRIQKYENGARKPKLEILRQIANALEVNVLALTDITIDTPESAMHALFGIEDKYGIEFCQLDMGFSIRIKDDDMGEYLRQWKDKNQEFLFSANIWSYTEDERMQFRKDYDNWRWCFPQKNKSEDERQKLEEEAKKLERRLSQIKQQLVDLDKNQPS